MSIGIALFRGQGVRVEGRGYGVIHGYMSPTEVRVKFREGFETIRISDLLSVSAIETVARRLEESHLDIELANPIKRRDNEIEPEITGEELEEELQDSKSQEEEQEEEQEEVEEEEYEQ